MPRWGGAWFGDLTEPGSRCSGCEPVALDGLNPRFRFRRCLARGPFAVSGGELPAVVPGEAEVAEPSRVQGGGSDREAELVAFDAAVADAAVAVAGEPGDGSFDQWSVGSVVRGDIGVGSPALPVGGEEFVVGADRECLAASGGGAS